MADACHARGIKAVAVTAGYQCAEPRAEFYGHMDAANVDLKAFTEEFYHKMCVGHLGAVLETLEYLKHETSVWFEITTLLIPGENDSDAELHGESQWIAERLGPDVPLHFTAFHPDWKMTDQPPTPGKTLTRARAIALEPMMIMYDEPFTGLDPISKGVIAKLIRELNQSLGITSIVVSHDVAETCMISDYAYLVGDGRIIGEGTPAEVQKSKSEHVRQFMDGLPDGPVPYQYPADDYIQDLTKSAA